MNSIIESLGDPIWQIGGGIIILAALVLILALRSPDVHLSPQQQQVGTRITLLVGPSLFLLLSTGVVFAHGVNASPTSANEATFPSPTPSSPPVRPSPTPFPSLTSSPAQVLTMFCEAINRHDLDTAWEQCTKALQKKRTEPAPPAGRITIVHCSVGDVNDTSATGVLFLRTIEPNGYTDGYERPFQFTLSVEDGPGRLRRSPAASLKAAWMSLRLLCP